MKCNVMFLSLFITAFLFSSVGSVSTVEATASQISDCKSDVKWHKKKNQVKDKDRRKYLTCLASYVAGTTDIGSLIEEATAGCIPADSYSDRTKTNSAVSLVSRGLGGVGLTDFGHAVKDKDRRSTIVCLEGALR